MSKAKSHSVISNFQLLLISLFGILSFTLLWLSIIFKDYFTTSYLWYTAIATSAVLVLVSGLMFNRFKR